MLIKDGTHHASTPSPNSLCLKHPPPPARPTADSQDVLKAGQERLERQTWSGAVKETKRILLFNYFIKISDVIKCPRYIQPIVLN